MPLEVIAIGISILAAIVAGASALYARNANAIARDAHEEVKENNKRMLTPILGGKAIYDGSPGDLIGIYFESRGTGPVIIKKLAKSKKQAECEGRNMKECHTAHEPHCPDCGEHNWELRKHKIEINHDGEKSMVGGLSHSRCAGCGAEMIFPWQQQENEKIVCQYRRGRLGLDSLTQ